MLQAKEWDGNRGEEVVMSSYLVVYVTVKNQTTMMNEQSEEELLTNELLKFISCDPIRGWPTAQC